jgi:predicted glycosyltransferase
MRCWLLHPDVIPAEAFERQGVRADRLIPMRGLKEDISFARVDLAAAPAFAGPTPQPGVSRILFRPPAEESHYYDERSKSLADALLRHLSAREDVSVLYAPRYEWQGDELAAYEWKHEPTRLGSAVQFVSLLKSVDAVVSSGGTMVREAAYVGIPAYSILRSRIGAVDRYLESLGRLRVVESASDFAQLQFSRVKGFSRLEDNPNLLDEVVEEILRRSAVGRVSPAGAFAPAESRMTAGSRP